LINIYLQKNKLNHLCFLCRIVSKEIEKQVESFMFFISKEISL